MHLSLNAKARGATVPGIYRKDSGSVTGIWLCSTLTHTHTRYTMALSPHVCTYAEHKAGQQLEESNCFGGCYYPHSGTQGAERADFRANRHRFDSNTTAVLTILTRTTVKIY